MRRSASRSWGGYAAVQAAGLCPPTICKKPTAVTLLFAMIETQEALDNRR